MIKLLADKSKTAGFSYLIPSIPDSSATLVAGEGDVFTELGVTHKDGLVLNTSGLSLSIPTPARDLAVTPNTDLTKVSATTQFSFKPGGSANAPFVATFAYEDNSVHDDILFVVSAKAPFKLPKVVNGAYTLPARRAVHLAYRDPWRSRECRCHGRPERLFGRAEQQLQLR